jgi:hypothetical protein
LPFPAVAWFQPFDSLLFILSQGTKSLVGHSLEQHVQVEHSNQSVSRAKMAIHKKVHFLERGANFQSKGRFPQCNSQGIFIHTINTVADDLPHCHLKCSRSRVGFPCADTGQFPSQPPSGR